MHVKDCQNMSEYICTLPKVEQSFSQMNSIMPATTNKMETKTLALRLCKLSDTANYQILPPGKSKDKSGSKLPGIAKVESSEGISP